MKKKKWLLIGIGVFIILSVLSVIAFTKYTNYKAHKRHQEAITYTNKKYEQFTKNKISDNTTDKVSIYLNNIVKQKQNNDKINFDTFKSNTINSTTFIKDNLTQLIGEIEKEEKEYDLSLLNFSKDELVKQIDDSKVDKDTLINIYQNYEFIKNIDKEKEIRNNYLTNLKELKEYITYFNDNKDNFYINNAIYIAKNDEVLNKLKEMNDKYNLQFAIEKEEIKDTAQTTNIKGSAGVPILCYHGILDNPWGMSSLFVKVAEFEAQMKYLSENGYTTLFTSEISSANKYEKPIIITFDDGYKDVYTNAFPILKKYNLKANVYMISGWINGDVYMTTDMTKEMNASPLIEIGSHTVSHKALATLTDEQIEYEVSQSKKALEEMLGTNIDVIAYPTGSYDNRVLNITSKYYKYGLSTNKGKEIPGKLNTYHLNRIYVYRSYGINEFKNAF